MHFSALTQKDVVKLVYNPLVSIIVPVYNAEKYIKECVNSIINQTYRNIEIILVNDGSKDSSSKICQLLAKNNPRVKYISQNNKGPSAARNKGIRYAKGDYIQFVDSDDIIEDNMTEELVRAKDKNSQLVLCGYNIISRNKTSSKKPNIAGNYTREEFLRCFGSLFSNRLINSPCNKLYDKKILDENNLYFDEGISIGEDLLFNLDFLNCCSAITILPKTLYNYNRFNTNSLTQSYINHYFENQQKLYDSIRFFLLSNNKYIGNNIEHIETSYTNRVIESIANLFHNNNDLSEKAIRENIKAIILHIDVRRSVKYFQKGNIQKKTIGLFIKLKLVNGIYYSFKVRRFFSNIIKTWRS